MSKPNLWLLLRALPTVEIGVGEGSLQLVEGGSELVVEVGGGVVGLEGHLALEGDLVPLHVLLLTLPAHQLRPQTRPETGRERHKERNEVGLRESCFGNFVFSS